MTKNPNLTWTPPISKYLEISQLATKLKQVKESKVESKDKEKGA